MKLFWRAVYRDKTIVAQMNEDLTVNDKAYLGIDREQLDRFELCIQGTDVSIISIAKARPGMRVFCRCRTKQQVGVDSGKTYKLKRVWVVGWRERVPCGVLLFIAWVFENGRVELRPDFIPGDVIYKPINFKGGENV